MAIIRRPHLTSACRLHVLLKMITLESAQLSITVSEQEAANEQSTELANPQSVLKAQQCFPIFCFIHAQTGLPELWVQQFHFPSKLKKKTKKKKKPGKALSLFCCAQTNIQVLLEVCSAYFK